MLWSELSKKKALTVMGLSSGTSADGLDMAVTRVSGLSNLKIKQLNFTVHKYPARLRQLILDAASAREYSVDKIGYLHYRLGEFFAEAAIKILKKKKIRADLIGSHGQTIRHLPQPRFLSGRKTRVTWQLGEAEIIAKKTGVVTVSNFRAADLAAGGQGAPLTPFINYLLFGNYEATAVLNIGGIANLSAWPRHASWKDILGFDCGPGNLLVDGLARILCGKQQDTGGRIALKGRVNQQLLTVLKRHSFLKRKLPRSSGREDFGEAAVNQTLKVSRKSRLPKADLIATASEFTVQCIYESYRRFVLPQFTVKRLFLTGGGVYNRYFVKRLRKLFGRIEFACPEDYGYDSKALEAVSFAVLAYLAVHNLPGDLPQVTGAGRRVVLGNISLP
jgi:anhydro-N-acetylmuramic acid kinase